MPPQESTPPTPVSLQVVITSSMFGIRMDGCDSQAGEWNLETIKANPKQRFFKTHANLKDLPCGKAPGVKVTVDLMLCSCAPGEEMIALSI